MDLVEINGGLEIRYAIGTQSAGPGSFVAIRRATYNGTLDNFLAALFD